ncbi:MAG: DUF58 domain-containing protein [Azospirillaceae bacterium]
MSATLHQRAAAAAARFPPLAVTAARVAATVEQGTHGRRRSGLGDDFWQFRPYLPGDPASRIDWRQSAKRESPHIREREQAVAQSTLLWADRRPAMAWSSSKHLATKADTAALLVLALADLLGRGGEAVGWLGGSRPRTGRSRTARLAEEWTTLPDADRPPSLEHLPIASTVVLASDFLDPVEELAQALAPLGVRRAGGVLLQVLDPAEADLPYRGRVEFHGTASGLPVLLPRVEAVRQAYVERLRLHQDALAALARQRGWILLRHRTDQAPEAALLALYMAMTQ